MDDTLSLDLQQTDFGRDIDKEIKRLDKRVDDEAEARSAADLDIWQEINTIEAASDVVDVVGTYSELENYDTSTLHDKDLIKVLADETHDDAITYYRWSTSLDAFSYVGAEGPYYTTAETDALLGGKQDTLIAGSNIQIAADGKTISATDTTYTAGTGINITGNEISFDNTVLTHGALEFQTAQGTYTFTENSSDQTTTIVIPEYDDFIGTDGQAAGSDGLVPGPATTDAGKFLKADGTWDTPPGTTYTAGTNIQINNDVISATDTTYSAGSGITIDAGNAISADDQLHNLDLYAYFDGANPEVFQYNNNRLPIFFGGNIYWDSVNGCINAADTTYTAGTNVWISSGNVISATDTTYSAFTGATSAAAGVEGLVPAPAAGDEDKVLKGNGSWAAGYERVELFLAVPFYPTIAPFEIYKDSLRQDPITWDEFRYLLTESSKKDIVLHVNNSSDTMYTLLEYWDNTTEFSVFDVDSNAIYYITANSDDLGETEFKVAETTELQEKLTAGSNITITNGTISATVPATNNISSNDWSGLWQ